MAPDRLASRSEEHTSELQSRLHLVCRLLVEKKDSGVDSTRVLAPHGTAFPPHADPALPLPSSISPAPSADPHTRVLSPPLFFKNSRPPPTSPPPPEPPPPL